MNTTLLPRLHLVELEDLSWFPTGLRAAMTDYLATVVHLADPFAAAVPALEDALGRASERAVVDVCSGGGGPFERLAPRLGVRVTLTDRFPNTGAFDRLDRISGGLVRGEPRAVDAHALPSELRGVRTLFDGLHHFRPAHAAALLRGLGRTGEPIVVAEAVERSILGVIGMLFLPLVVMAVMPFVRGFSPFRFVFTYLVPVLPLVIAWDGLVSTLRVYTPAELEALGREALPHYTWKAERHARGTTVLYGHAPRA